MVSVAKAGIAVVATTVGDYGRVWAELPLPVSQEEASAAIAIITVVSVVVVDTVVDSVGVK